MLEKEFHTGNLSFRPLSQTDAADFYSLVTNRSVMQYITGYALSPDEANAKFRSYVSFNQSNEAMGYFCVTSLDDQSFAGVCKLIPWKGSDAEAEIGYMLMPGFWGRGYATAMVKVMLTLAQQIGIERAVAIVDPENIPSFRVLQKFGFTLYDEDFIENLPAHYYGLNINTLSL